MRFPKLLSLVALLLASGLSFHAQPEIKALQNKDYAQLDKRYAQAVSEHVDILTSPRLAEFFEALALPYSASDAQWEERLQALGDWCQAQPESKPALLAHAHALVAYGQKARGTSLARDVTEENWKRFHERSETARRLLLEHESLLSGEVQFHYLLARIDAPGGSPFDTTLAHVANLRRLSPAYWPAYSLLTTYLLERWGAEVGQLERYAKAAADEMGGEDGDILYARMMDAACYFDEDRFVELHQPDVSRLYKGYELMIGRVANDRRWRTHFQSGFAYAAGVLGDWPKARQLLIDTYPASYHTPWNGYPNYVDHLRRSGALQEQGAIELLEYRGELNQAEVRLLALEPRRELNFALAGFYLRHARADDFFAAAGAPARNRPINSLSMDDTANACRVFSALRLHDEAREAALRFDQKRGHNLTGKLALYQAALASGDAEAVNRARKAIVNLKTNRPAYRAAQEFLQSREAALPKLDWNDPFSFQAATAVALGCYERGDAANARTLLAEAAGRCFDYEQRELLRSLFYHPPVAVEN